MGYFFLFSFLTLKKAKRRRIGPLVGHFFQMFGDVRFDFIFLSTTSQHCFFLFWYLVSNNIQYHNIFQSMLYPYYYPVKKKKQIVWENKKSQSVSCDTKIPNLKCEVHWYIGKNDKIFHVAYVKSLVTCKFVWEIDYL